jgi:hypothetical protein
MDESDRLAAGLGPGVRPVALRLRTGEPWCRFVIDTKILGSGFAWAEAHADAARELARRLLRRPR